MFYLCENIMWIGIAILMRLFTRYVVDLLLPEANDVPVVYCIFLGSYLNTCYFKATHFAKILAAYNAFVSTLMLIYILVPELFNLVSGIDDDANQRRLHASISRRLPPPPVPQIIISPPSRLGIQQR